MPIAATRHAFQRAECIGASLVGLDGRAREWRASQQADQPPLPACVAVDVMLGRLNGSVPSEQLHIAQAATRAVDVASGARDERAPAEMRRAPFEAEFAEQRREPVDHARWPQMAAAGGANDRPRTFA